MFFKKEGIMEGGNIIMSLEELRRESIIKQSIEKVITQKKAGELIEISERQVRRIIKKIREEGAKGIVHKSRGRISNRKIEDSIRIKVIKIYNKKYQDFGPTFASEKLYELDKIKIYHDTLRRWLVAGKKGWEWQRKGRKHRQWRPRKEYFGEMTQIDGSHHAWLEDRGPELVLMIYIDDATNTVHARFYDYEGVMPAMDSFKRYIKEYGVPQSVYLDKHSTYKTLKKEQTIEEKLKNERPMSQFERAMDKLKVKVIHANSPQAKGRVERTARTFQDRLLKELRLAGIKTKEKANEFLDTYLPKHNKRFGLIPAKEGDLHRKAPGAKVLKEILSMKTKKSLGNDGVIRHNSRFYQIEGISRTIKSVIVEERLDGSMHIRNNGSFLRYREIDPKLIRRPTVSKKQATKPRKAYMPVKDFPWKRRFFPDNRCKQAVDEPVLTNS